MKKIAILVCTYEGDNITQFNEMIDSIYNANLPDNYICNIYLHIDGVISDEMNNNILGCNIFRVVRSNKNIGLASGLNKLIRLIEDESYIFRMDSDDICIKDRFLQQISYMDDNPSVDISGGSIDEFIGSTDNIVFRREYPKNNKDILLMINKACPFAHVTVCFRANFFSKFGLYPEGYPLNEDIAFWFQALKQGAVGGNIASSLVSVRMDSAYSRRSIKKSFHELRVYILISCWKKKLPVYPIFRFLFRLCPSFIVKMIYNSNLRTMLLK